jgi:ABC-type transporter Mla subunit MlaD
MSFTEKIDVLELLIGILHDHEKALDEIVEKLEVITKTLNNAPILS